jgi:hypothetical protein
VSIVMEEGQLFEALASARTFDSLEEAIAAMRYWAFGWNDNWEGMTRRLDMASEERLWRRACRRVGPEFAAVLSGRRQLSLVQSEPPREQSWQAPRARAAAIAGRFGFSALRTTLDVNDFVTWLNGLEEALESFAHSLGWPTQAIGALHLGLDVTTRMPRHIMGRYDWRSHTLQLSNSSAFIHEFAHALDFSRGDAAIAILQPHSLKRRPWSSLIQDHQSIHQPLHDELLEHQERDRVSPVESAKEASAAISAAILRLSKTVPRQEWEGRILRRSEALEQWRATAAAGHARRARAIWERWRVAVGLIFADAHAPEDRAWVHYWLRLMEQSRTVMESPWSDLSGWRLFAASSANEELALPAEMTARALEAVWASSLGSSILLPDELLADEYPIGAGLLGCKNWWSANKDAWFEAWISQDPRAILHE